VLSKSIHHLKVSWVSQFQPATPTWWDRQSVPKTFNRSFQTWNFLWGPTLRVVAGLVQYSWQHDCRQTTKL